MEGRHRVILMGYHGENTQKLEPQAFQRSMQEKEKLYVSYLPSLLLSSNLKVPVTVLF